MMVSNKNLLYLHRTQWNFPPTFKAAKRVWAGLLRSVLRGASKQLRVDRGWDLRDANPNV